MQIACDRFRRDFHAIDAAIAIGRPRIDLEPGFPAQFAQPPQTLLHMLASEEAAIGDDPDLHLAIQTGVAQHPAGEDVRYDENPGHTVRLDAYWIDCYEVTNRLYKRFVDATGHRAPFVEAEWAEPYNWINTDYPPGTGEYPVVLVSWEDAAAYAAWAGKRLPTEAEWEKAARGGRVKQQYPFGDAIDEKHANYFTSIITTNRLKPVGSFPPNPYGLYDMSGNVWEWCGDWYLQTYYRGSPDANPQGPSEGLYRVFRGGSWINRAEQLRCSERARNVPSHQSHIIGFRCARSAEPGESPAEGIQVRQDGNSLS